MILGGGPNHRRAAHIDVLNSGVPIGPLCDSLFKRIEIDYEKINISDVVGLFGTFVGRIVSNRQKSTMNFGMQGFHAAIHDFGKARQGSHIDGWNASGMQVFCGAAG
jgi:hypothetical protein